MGVNPDSSEERSKIVVADNPWHIAAAAKERGVQVSCIELDGLPTDKVYVIDPDTIRRGISEVIDANF